MALEITPSGQACGAFVRGVDLRGDLTDAQVGELREAWLANQVLVFPEQPMNHDQLTAHSLRFGPFGDDPYLGSLDDNEHVVALHRAADETASIFADVWHADWSFQQFPPDGTCLHAKVIPPVGGDTQFINQYAALEEMPLQLRSQLEGRIAVHSARFGYSPDGAYGDADEGSERAMKIIADDTAYETETHPLIAPHRETGRDTLYSCFGYIIGLVGMDDAAAQELLQELHRWQTQERFQYRHRWEPNMLVMWDNRCVLHRANGGYDGHERLLHRTTIGFNHDVAA